MVPTASSPMSIDVASLVPHKPVPKPPDYAAIHFQNVVVKGQLERMAATKRAIEAAEAQAKRQQALIAPPSKPTTTPMPPPASSGTAVWDQLARCESGANWSINTGNGFFGGIQFDYQTWLSNGGGEFASRADLATREQQIIIAERVRTNRGFSPWPACARSLGLI